MNAQLLIGDAAKLAGVTTKTIRHYHKLGLLIEPERTESGYRLYTASHLLRLHQIKQLQSLGFSLHQISKILGEAIRGDSIADVLRVLHAEIVAQIEELQQRREQIETLLRQENADLLEPMAGEPPTLKLLQEQLGETLQIDWTTWDGRTKPFAQLDSLLWSQADYQEQQRALIDQISANPQELRPILGLMAQIAALASHDADSPVVTELAAEIVRSYRQNPLFAQLTEGFFTPEFAPNAWDEMMTEVGGAPLSAAQRQLLALVAKQLF